MRNLSFAVIAVCALAVSGCYIDTRGGGDPRTVAGGKSATAAKPTTTGAQSASIATIAVAPMTEAARVGIVDSGGGAGRRLSHAMMLGNPRRDRSVGS
jgi:hypothetical protein